MAFRKIRYYLGMSKSLPTGLDRLPSGKIRARYQDAEGKQHSKAFDGVRDAQRWRTAQVAAVHRGDHVSPNSALTLLEYAEQWAASRPHRELTKVQMKTYLNHVRNAPIGSRPIRLIRSSEVQAWVAGRSEALAAQTVHNVYTWLKAVFASAVEDRLIPFTPCTRRIALPRIEKKEITPLTVDEVRRLADEMPERYRMMVILQAAIGVRISELLALKVSDVDFMRRTVRVERQLAKDGRRFVPVKGTATTRKVPLAQEVALLLSAHIAKFPPNADGVIFTTARGGNPVRYNLYQPEIFDPAAKRAGMPDVKTHDLRHHFASVLLSMNVPVNVIANYLGHADATLVIKTYSHLMPDAEDVTRKALDLSWSSPVVELSREPAARR